MTRTLPRRPDEDPAPPPQGTLSPTSTRDVVLAAVAGGVLGYVIVATVQAGDAPVPITPWTLPGMLATLAAVGAWYAASLRRRVRADRHSITPEEGVRALVIGKVMLLAGALLAGGHLVYALVFLGRWSAPAPHDRVVHGIVTAVCAALFAASGRRLESACKVPDDEPRPPGDAA